MQTTVAPVPFCSDCALEDLLNGSGDRSCRLLNYRMKDRPRWLDVERHTCLFRDFKSFFTPNLLNLNVHLELQK